MTDDSPHRLHALQRCGALRLTKKEFEGFIHDVQIDGRHPIVDRGDRDLISRIGMYEALHLAAAHEIDLESPNAFSDWLLLILTETDRIPPPTARKRQ